LGMLLAGALVDLHPFTPLLLLAACGAATGYGLPPAGTRRARVRTRAEAAASLDRHTLIMAVAHNWHYYLYSFWIPMGAYAATRSGLVAAAVFVVGWIAYVFDVEMVEALRAAPPARLVSGAFLALFACLAGMAYVLRAGAGATSLAFLAPWFATGVAAALALAYTRSEAYRRRRRLYRTGWTLGGAMGAVSGVALLAVGASPTFLLVTASAACLIAACCGPVRLGHPSDRDAHLQGRRS